ncbi:ECF transporter S component [Williamsoniiplasma luminosum]|uniref:ECF transporter S component n=1 Tax=Williamsoniiplasma luminosum TaxID=214888 RepID=A0A2S0NJS4_9MOLU|nr:ECF transporter S component [Williamsoniiplasma luminosum]AVP49258.1 MAG: hypothetical protein C5T88_01525 [Williamsoniiplasma luminosum]
MKKEKKPKINSNKNLKNIWGNKFDTSEINRRNRKIIIKNYFSLSIKKITLISMMVTLNIVVSAFSKFVIGMVPINGFFVLEVSFFTILIFLLITNLFYTIFFIQMTTWFRVAFGDEWVGLLAMDLIDSYFIIIFAFILFIVKYLMVKFKTPNILNKVFWLQIPIFIIVILLTAGFGTLLNWGFLLTIYGMPEQTQIGYLPIIFGLNIAKYSINVLIFMLLYKPVLILIKNYQF